MKIRKKMIFFAAIGMAAAVCAAGCGSSSGSADADAGDAQEVEAEADAGGDEEAAAGDASADLGSTGYVFTMTGADGSAVTFGVDDDADAIVALLGDCDSVYEAESCAGQGTAYIYTYGSVEIETYPDDSGANLVAFITLKDDTVATPEGVDLSFTKDQVVEVYGEAASEDTGLIYEKDGMKLEFIFSGDDMDSIEYVSPVAG